MSFQSSVVISLSALGAIVLVAAVATLRGDEPGVGLDGVWRTVEVVVPGPTPQTLRPAATLAIFHGRHYSRVEVHAQGPRPALNDPATASADELRAAWGPVVAEAGTFAINGNSLTMQAVVAKNPAAMASVASSVFTYQRTGDLLTLTQVPTAAHPEAVPVTIEPERVE